MKTRNQMTKAEKRRLLFNRNYEMSAKNRANYGAEFGAAVVMGKTVNFNRRLLAAFLALVFVVTSVVVGWNISVKAVTGNDVGLDGTYSAETNVPIYTFTNRNNGTSQIQGTAISFEIDDGRFKSFSITTRNYLVNKQKVATSTTDNDAMEKTSNTSLAKYPFRDAPQAVTDIRAAANALVGKDATYSVLSQIAEADYPTGTTGNIRKAVYSTIRDILLSVMKDVPRKPRTPEKIDDYVDPPKLPESASSFLELNKTISPSADSSAYDLKLESYSSADTSKFEIWEKVPTDYVVVVDQSASMKTEDMATNYVSAGKVNLEDIGDETTTNDKYYYVDPNGDTYRVFAETGYLYEYFPENSKWTKDIVEDSGGERRWFQSEKEQSPDMKNLYYYKTDDGVYRPLTVSITGTVGTYYVKLRYADPNNPSGEPIYFRRPDQPWYKNLFGGDGTYYTPNNLSYGIVNSALQAVYRDRDAYTFSEATVLLVTANTGMYINYPMYKRHVGYTRLVYRDKNGDIVPVPSDAGVDSTEYCNSSGQAVTEAGGTTRMTYTGKLLKSSQDTKRLDALKMALQVFTKTVEGDVDSYGSVDNRIAFVGFSSENSSPWHYNNTEVLSGVSIDTTQKLTNGKDGNNTHNGYFPIDETNFNGPQYFKTNEDYGDVDAAYKTALVDASAAYNSIDYFTAYGGTQPADGLDMAKEIFAARDNTTYTYRSGSKKTVERNKVVIFFTDGQPGNFSTSNQYAEANKVVEKAYELKQDVGAKIFSIGVFGVADATPLTYLRHETTNDDHTDYEYEQGWINTISNKTTTTNWNWIFPTTSTDTIRSYLNRYWLSSDPASYGETANDTIYDYMSTVSSNFPNAKKFISDYWAASGENAGDDTTEGEDPAYNSWNDMVQQLRGDRISNYGAGEGKENYYRLASNTESLIEAFKSAAKVTEVEVAQDVGEMDENVKTIDFINDSNFDIPLSDSTPTLDVEVEVVPVTKAADGTITEGTPVSVADYNANHTNQISWAPGTDNKSVIVTGFDYNAHCVTTENNNAAKLVVKVKGLTPKNGVTGEYLTSNTNNSGIYAEDELLKAFPEPAIARYKYELNVTDADSDAQFNLEYTLAANQGVTADFNNILISNEGLPAGTTNRERYSAGNLKSVANATNGSAIYLEYITAHGKDGTADPADYSLTASVVPASADAGKYTYYLDTADYVDLASPDDTKLLPLEGRVETLPTTTNGNLYVDSIANNRQVTIKETVNGSFANESDTFTPTLYLVPPAGTTVPSSETYGETTWTKDGESNRLVFTPSAIRGDNSDSLILTVPVGWTLQIAQVDDNHYDVTHMEYIASTAEANVTDITEDKSLVVTDDVTVTITNTRDNIPVTGMTSSDNQTLVYILSSAGALALAAGGYYVWKKKDEFVEE